VSKLTTIYLTSNSARPAEHYPVPRARASRILVCISADPSAPTHLRFKIPSLRLRLYTRLSSVQCLIYLCSLTIILEVKRQLTWQRRWPRSQRLERKRWSKSGRNILEYTTAVQRISRLPVSPANQIITKHACVWSEILAGSLMPRPRLNTIG